jgi:hypothetical protein
MLNSARHRHRAVVSQEVAVEGIEGGIIDVGNQHALAEVVEHHDSHSASQSAEGLLVQLRPGA